MNSFDFCSYSFLATARGEFKFVVADIESFGARFNGKSWDRVEP